MLRFGCEHESDEGVLRMVSQRWLHKMKTLADKEQRWERVRSGSRVSPEEDRLAGALLQDGFRIRRQVKIFLRGFARQVGIPYYRVDFLVEGILVVEVDSYSHRNERRAWDQQRDAILGKLGYHVVRLTNEEIQNGLANCVGRINRSFQSLVRDR